MIRGTTKLAAVIGWPVEHSQSPQLMNAAFAAAKLDAVMVPIAVPPDGFAAVVAGLRAMQALGASVTVPHKLAAYAACDELSQAARSIGAVNCLHVDGDVLVGHNTDADGFADGLARAGFKHQGKRAVVLGSGGAARAVAYGLRGLRAVEVVARAPVEWAVAWPWSAENLSDVFARADLVVDCTSVALTAGDAETAFVDALPLAALRPGAWVASLVYHRPPLLLARAAAAGHPTLDGWPMLVGQAARAFAIWTGQPAPVAEMANAGTGQPRSE